MKQQPSLDDLELFARVGQAGGLAPVARRSGVSVPTLSRRMRALEAQLGWHLFERGAQGYRLTAQGRAFLEQTEPLLAEAHRLRQVTTAPAPVEVRVTAGSWTSAFLARHLGRIWSPGASWRVSFLAAEARLDIARRGADIGIRNHPPSQNWLAGRRLGRVSYAEFALDAEVSGYVTLGETSDPIPSATWVRGQYGAAIVATANSARLLADLACAGVGRVVLPRFAAAAYPSLQQVGPEIAELCHDEWLVCHHEARHDPPIRVALEGIAQVLTDRSLRPGAVQSHR